MIIIKSKQLPFLDGTFAKPTEAVRAGSSGQRDRRSLPPLGIVILYFETELFLG
jgi:hypothetical protein